MSNLITNFQRSVRCARPCQAGGVDDPEFPQVSDRPTPEQLSERLAQFWKQCSPQNGIRKHPNDPPRPVYSSSGKRWPNEDEAAKELGLTKRGLQQIIMRPLGYRGIVYDFIPITEKARSVLLGNAGGQRKPGLDENGRVRKSRAKYFGKYIASKKRGKDGHENRQGR